MPYHAYSVFRRLALAAFAIAAGSAAARPYCRLASAALAFAGAMTFAVTGRAALIDYEKNLDAAFYRDLTSAKFSTRFAQLKRSHILIDFDSYPHDGGVRYAMVWRENTDGRGWALHRDLTSGEYAEKFDEYRAKGWRLHDVEAYWLGPRLVWAGIWIQNKEGLGWASRRGMTGEEYGVWFKQQRARRRRLVDIEVYLSGGLRYYAAIFYDNPDKIKWASLRNMTREQYQQEFDERWDRGFVVIDFESHQTPAGQQRYAAIWEKRPPKRAWQVRSDRTKLQFSNLWREYRDKGFRLVDFERYETADGARYAGVWIENFSRFRYARKGDLNSQIAQYRFANILPGISVAVIRDGEVIYRRGFGFADVAAGKVAHGETVYNAASVAKVVGGTLAAKLEDEGKLADGQPVSLNLQSQTETYLGDNLPPQHVHKVQELLAHLGCVAHYGTTPAIPNQTTHYTSATSAVMSIWTTALVSGCQVGLTLTYSTPGYTFVDAVLERITFRTIERLVREEIAERYGFRSMRVQWAKEELPANYDRAVPYTININPATYSDTSWKVTGGGLEMHAVDMARFGWKVLNGEIVSPSARDNRMWTPVRTGCGSSIGGACQYGLAWRLRTYGGRRVVEKRGGWNPGARSLLRVYRDDGLVIAIMSNKRQHSTSGDIEQLATCIGNTVLASAPPPPCVFQ